MHLDPFPETIPELLQARAAASPRLVASYHRDAGGSWVPDTCEAVFKEVQAFAVSLQELGVTREDRIAILASTCREWQIAELAGLSLGATIVGVDPQASPDRINYMLEHCKATCLICHRLQDMQKVAAPIRSAQRLIVLLHNVARSQDGQHIYQWGELLSHGNARLHTYRVTASEPATIIYTSGTTGRPKGIEYSHGQMMIACRSIVEIFPQLEAGDITICWLPLAHLFQRIWNLVSMAFGLISYFVEDPREIMQIIQDVSPSVFIGVPRFYEKLDHELQNDPDAHAGWIRNVKFMFTGSAATAPSLLNSLRSKGLLVLEAYGVSENTVPIAVNRVDEYRVGSVGKPCVRSQFRITRPEGEILVKGPGLFTGYLGEVTNDRFTSDGFYRTGDCGRIDEDGYLFLTGRTSDMFKTSTGRRIYPGRIEAVYRQSACIDQFVVFGDGLKSLVALVTLNASAFHDILEHMGLTSATGEELASQHVIKQLVRRDIELFGESLSDYERIRNFAILAESLSVAQGELTPTLKPRRDRIAAKYRNLIEKLCQEDRPSAGPSQTDETEALDVP